MSKIKEIDLKDLSVNPFEMIGKEWMLITAKNGDKVNTMTASWGGMGVMWNHNVVFAFIRQSRYTKEFIDGSDSFSISFYPESEKKTLAYLGTASGRDEDKIEKAGYNVLFDDNTPYFEEAKVTFICKKLSRHYIGKEGMIDDNIVPKWYSGEDENNYHDMYIGTIEKVLVKED